MNTNCTIFKTADFIGKKWTLLILLELYKGETKTKRHNELKKAIPEITPKILSARLKELEEQKLITKEMDTSEIPIKTFYKLTESGEEFFNIIQDIKKWALKWKINNKVCSETNCEKCVF